MHKNIAYLLGFLTGLLCVALITLAIRWMLKKKGHSYADYDERQLLARGQAAQYGFWVTIFYMLFVGGLNPQNIPLDALMYLGGCLGLGVFGCICIIRDAYFPVSNQSNTKITLIIILLIVAAASNLIMGLLNDPINEVHLLNLILGIMLCILLLVLSGKLIYDKTNSEQKEEV